MKAVCITRKIASTKSPFHSSDEWFEREDLTIGNEYQVYGFCYSKEILCYLVAADTYSYFPLFIPSNFFTAKGPFVGQLYISKSLAVTNNSLVGSAIDFALDESYYEKLVDGEESAIKAWQVYKAYIDSIESNLDYELHNRRTNDAGESLG